jgi:hypothetical protein
MEWDLYTPTSDNNNSDSSVSIVTRLWAGWQKNRCSIPSTQRDFSSLRSVVTGPGVHLAPYPVVTRDSFPSDKADAA